MPALPNVPAVLRCVLKYTNGADVDVVNRFFLRYTGTAPSDGDLDGWITTVVEPAWNTNLKSLYNADTHLVEIIVEDLTSATAGVGDEAFSVAGTRSGSTLPAGVALVLSSVIARRYRGGHPRMYLAVGVGDDLQTTQTWTSAFMTAVLTGWDAFTTALFTTPPGSTSSLVPVNVSYYQGFHAFEYPSGRWRNIPTVRGGGAGPAVVDLVSNWKVNPKVASQRRRNLQGV